jgi:dinuclear metal center YbgI/SA1388 family protein
MTLNGFDGLGAMGRVVVRRLESDPVALPLQPDESDREMGDHREVGDGRELNGPGVPLSAVVAALEERYDPALAESWDAVGLVCGDPQATVRSVLFAVDPTAAVVDEAIERGADLVVTHHPLLLTPVHGVPADDPKGRLVHRLIRAGVGLFVAHTNADRAADHGVNDALAGALGLVGAVPLEHVPTPGTDTLVVFVPLGQADVLIDALSSAGAGVIGDYTHCAWHTTGTGTFVPGEEASPTVGTNGHRQKVPEVRIEMVVSRSRRSEVLRVLYEGHPYEDPGYALFENGSTPSRAGLGRIGALPEPMTLREFAAHVASVLPVTVGGVRAAGDPDRQVRTVAACGGSGGSLLATAAAAGADVLVTSDLKHHLVSQALEAGGPALCDVAHFATEWPWLPGAADLLRRDLDGRIAVAVSGVRTDPWTWHAG